MKKFSNSFNLKNPREVSMQSSEVPFIPSTLGSTRTKKINVAFQSFCGQNSVVLEERLGRVLIDLANQIAWFDSLLILQFMGLIDPSRASPMSRSTVWLEWLNISFKSSYASLWAQCLPKYSTMLDWDLIWLMELYPFDMMSLTKWNERILCIFLSLG